MVIRLQKVTLDTCTGNTHTGCEYEEWWDDDNPESRGLQRILRVCSRHTALGLSGQSAYDDAIADSRARSYAYDAIRTSRPTVSDTDISFGFTKDRVLHLSIGQSLNASEKSALQAAVDARVGPGKAVID